MLALIAREIRDHIIYFIAAVICTAIFITLLTIAIYNFKSNWPDFYIGYSIPILVILVLVFSAMGVTQMYMDRNRRISAFLAVLPVTRSRILAARFIAGLLAIGIAIVPMTITSIVLNRLVSPPISVFPRFITDVLITAFLMIIACYCLGLLTGWTASKIAPTFGALGLNLVLVSLVFVKGFGTEIKLLLVLFIAACMARIWHKFKLTSL